MLLSQSINSYFNLNQKAVLLSIAQTAIKSRPRKSVKVFVVYGAYLNLCRKLRIQGSDESEFWTELKVVELAGFIKIKGKSVGGIGDDGYSLEDIQAAIYEDPNFEKMKRCKIIRDAVYELSNSQKSITRAQIKEVSGIDDPEEEIMDLIKKGIIMEVKPDDIRWV